MREVITQRLQALPKDARRVLSLASVIGREFGLAVLEELARLPRAELLRLLAAAARARIVSEAEDPGGPGPANASNTE